MRKFCNIYIEYINTKTTWLLDILYKLVDVLLGNLSILLTSSLTNRPLKPLAHKAAEELTSTLTLAITIKAVRGVPDVLVDRQHEAQKCRSVVLVFHFVIVKQ